MSKMIIAIDGYSSCGKSTVAKDLAKALQIAYVDTGAMYRCVTLYAIRHGLTEDMDALVAELEKIKITFKFDAKSGKNKVYLNGDNVTDEIRTIEVSNLVSKISAVKAIRAKMVDLQREFGKESSLVLDGRDIGTVVFPDADLKIFMTADTHIRAERRYEELMAKGENVSYEDIEENIKQRDEMDTTREESPLRMAEGSHILDNSYMTMEEQFEWIMSRLREKNLI